MQRLISHGAIPDGTDLIIVVPDQVDQDREAIRSWLAADPDRARAQWHNDLSGPVEWTSDGHHYQTFGLLQKIIDAATGQPPRAHLWPPTWFRTADGKTLHQIAEPLA